MPFYFAPMEGITGYIYRNAHHTCFGGVDQYFCPFIFPNQNCRFSSREINDILPEHNKGQVVPQLLSNRAEDFIWAAGELKRMGYQEVNLNLGCPSATVVSKGRGAGFLANPEALNSFLDQVFSSVDIQVSIKTRLGKEDAGEFPYLLKIFNQYSLKELIIHPRTRNDFYGGQPDLETFARALEESENPIYYNGDLFTPELVREFQNSYPQVEHLMIGRGLLTRPGMCREIRDQVVTTGEELKVFHDMLYEDYGHILSGDRNLLFKMKELWNYLAGSFDGNEKIAKKIKKAQKCREYEVAVRELFKNCPLKE